MAGCKMVKQQLPRVQDGEAAVAEGSRWPDSGGRGLEVARQRWQRVRDSEAAVAEGLRYEDSSDSICKQQPCNKMAVRGFMATKPTT